jgi:protein-S-isoprenylcysteine O-methyltransferase Ste14
MPTRDHPGVFIPPPLFFVVAFLIGWAIDRRRHAPIMRTDVGALYAIERGLGWVLVAAGIALAIWAALTFRRAKTGIVPITPATTVVAEGPYRFTRNPMYVAMAVAYLGAALLFNSFWILLLLLAAVAGISLYVIPREERYLSSKFGDAYTSYRKRVRRWL